MKNKNFLVEFLTCTVAPALIPSVLIIPEQHLSKTACWILLGLLYLIDVIFIWRFYRNSKKEKENLLANKVNSTAYTNAYQLSERKRNEIAKKTYHSEGEKEYSIPASAIPYDVHDYIAEICLNFRDTIAKITSIDQEYMAVTFIYHYDYEGASEKDRSWRWVVGKEASTRTKLDKFVERDCSLYNYLIKGKDGKVNSVFNNNKKDLAYEGHYYMSPRDEDHNKIGSVFAIKVLFGNNAENFVEGILLVSSYGKQFVEKGSEYTENGLKNLIFEELYPYYQRLLETELGVLYLRHEKNKTESKKTCDFNYCCKKERCEKGEETK